MGAPFQSVSQNIRTHSLKHANHAAFLGLCTVHINTCSKLRHRQLLVDPMRTTGCWQRRGFRVVHTPTTLWVATQKRMHLFRKIIECIRVSIHEHPLTLVSWFSNHSTVTDFVASLNPDTTAGCTRPDEQRARKGQFRRLKRCQSKVLKSTQKCAQVTQAFLTITSLDVHLPPDLHAPFPAHARVMRLLDSGSEQKALGRKAGRGLFVHGSHTSSQVKLSFAEKITTQPLK